MKVAIYVRVSTEEQAQHGISVDAQLEELREYAKKHNYDVYKEYIDAGYSGGLLHRPALDLLLSDAESKKFQVVLFVKLDRWFRSVPHYYKIQEVLESNDISWIATQEDYETITSSGKFKVNIMLSVSQQFKDATSERIKSVFNYKVLNKKEVVSGTKIYGYDIVDKHYVINESEANVIRQMFELFKETYSYRTIHDFCVDNNTNSTRNTIKKRLRDKKYIGQYEYQGLILNDMIPPIVDEQLFNDVQEIIDKRKVVKSNARFTYHFASLITCAECGGKYAGTSNAIRKMYRCNRKINFKCSNNRTITEHKLEQIVINDIEKQIKELSINKTTSKEVLVDNTQQIRNKQNRLKELYIDGLISKKDFDSKYKELEKSIVKSKPSKSPINDLLGTYNFIDLFNKLNEKEKQIFFKNIIKNITISRDDIIVELID